MYMEILPNPDITCGTNKLCLLKKDIYELKQSPQVLFRRFIKVMMCLGYKQINETTLCSSTIYNEENWLYFLLRWWYYFYFYLFIYFLKTRYPIQGPTNPRGTIPPPTCGGPVLSQSFALYGLAHRN